MSAMREVERVLADEFLVRRFVLHAHSDYFVARIAVVVAMVAQATGFGGATAGVVFGIKIEGHFATCVVAQAYFCSVLVASEQVGGFVSYG